MRRREFITLLGGAVALAARGARAANSASATHRHPDGRRRRRGDQGLVGHVQTRLEQLGWHVGRNLQIDERWTAGDPERNRRFAGEILAMQPDAIFAFSSVAVAALQHENRSVPIVFTAISDPVGSGFVAKSRPSGWQRHGVYQFRADHGSEMARSPQGNRTGGSARRTSVQSSDRSLRVRILSWTIRGSGTRLRGAGRARLSSTKCRRSRRQWLRSRANRAAAWSCRRTTFPTCIGA